MEKTMLITGSSGHLGGRFLDFLYKSGQKYKLILPFTQKPPKGMELSDNLDIRLTLCNLCNQYDVKSLFSNYQIDTITHLAAKASVRLSVPQDIIDVNVKGTLNLLEYCQPNTEFLFASTILVYGGSPSEYHENDKCQPNSVYGISKLACEQLCNVYFKMGKIRPKILRFCGIVGKGMNHGRIYEAINGQTHFKLFGRNPGSSMPYISSQKCIEAIDLALKSPKNHLTCNICPNDSLSLADVFKTIEEKTKTKIELEWVDNSAQNDIIECHTEQSNYYLNWRTPESSLSELKKGLDEIYE